LGEFLHFCNKTFWKLLEIEKSVNPTKIARNLEKCANLSKPQN
jgi:hypothetical protein